MRQKTERHQGAAKRTIRDIRRWTRKHYSSEEKIRNPLIKPTKTVQTNRATSGLAALAFAFRRHQGHG